VLPNYLCHYHLSVTLRSLSFECMYGAFFPSCVLFCVQARASHVSPLPSAFFFHFFSFFFSDSCLAIITSLTFLLHISVHPSCTLIVNTLQNRDIVHPAAVNPSVVAKRKIAMREDVHHCFLRV